MAKSTCALDDCDRPWYCRDWCKLHYQRWLAHGDPTFTKVGKAHRWIDRIIADPPDGCAEWPFARNQHGYGLIYVDGVQRGAHRVVLARATGGMRDLHALHSCDNPPCCNPRHLRWGTDADNIQDSIDRDRWPVGERNFHAKLTEADVCAIRRAVLDGDSHATIAARHGVTRKAVTKIVDGRTWAHVVCGDVSMAAVRSAPRNGKVPPEVDERAHRLRAAGWSYGRIARHFEAVGVPLPSNADGSGVWYASAAQRAVVRHDERLNGLRD